jgi:hypothetical protein
LSDRMSRNTSAATMAIIAIEVVIVVFPMRNLY